MGQGDGVEAGPLRPGRQPDARAVRDGDDAPLDLLAEELRLAHDALGTITGVFDADALLGEIFGRFCIGK